MNIKRLSYFLRIAELGSMNKASEALHIAQPALTRQINLLETELGITLFMRNARGMQLTEEGKQLRAEISSPMRVLDAAFRNARLPAGQAEGVVTLGLTSSVRYVLAQPLISRIAETAPHVKLHIVEGQIDHLIEWLIAGRIDIALIYGPSPDSRIIDRDMLIEDLVLVGSAASALSPDHPINFNALADFLLLLPSSRHGMMATLEKNSYITGTTLNISPVDSFELIKQLVISGKGYTILPYSAIMREHEAGLLRYTRIDNPMLTRKIVTAATEQCRVPRLILRLDILIQEEILALSAAGRWPGKILINSNA